MINKIKINDRHKEKVNLSKFKNIKLYDYQIKTIEKLLDHERGQMKIENIGDFKFHSLYTELIESKKTDIQIKKLNQNYYNLKKNIFFNLGYNIGILSNKVGSGKTYIILGLIMSKNINSYKSLKKYYFDDIYNNTKFDRDVCSIISEYLVEPDDILFNTSKKNLNNSFNLFTSSKSYNEISNMVVYKEYINNLIIVPHNLYQQWKDEIVQNTNLNCHFIKTKRDLIKLDERIKNKDLILCNVNKLKELLPLIQNKYEINRLFIDEVDTINLSNFPEINSNFLWLITTTYERILKPKNLGFINNLFNSETRLGKRLMKKFLEKITYTFDTVYIDKKVDLKIPKKKYLIVQNNFLNKLFYNLNMKSYFKFINSYDYISLFYFLIKKDYYNQYSYISKIEYVYKFLYNYKYNIRDTIDILYIDYDDESSLLYVFIINNIRDYLIQFYNLFHLRKEYTKIINNINLYNTDLYNNNPSLLNNYKKILKNIKIKYNNLLKKLNILFYIRKQLIDNGYCLNCLHVHKINENCITTKFQLIIDLVYHNKNLLDFVDLLKKDIDIHLKIYKNFNIDINNFNFEPIKNISSNKNNLKIKHMIEKLKIDKKQKKRCLLFSDNYNFFKYIEKELKLNDVKARVLKGNSNTINSILKKYKNNDIDILLMNMKYCGLGLNLQMSDNIYIMNMIDKNTETQVIGRVNRINKIDNFEINYFFTDNEYQLYKEEKNLTEMLVDDSEIEEIIIEEI